MFPIQVGSPRDWGGGVRRSLLDAAGVVAYGAEGRWRYDRFWSDPGTSRSHDVATNGDLVLLSGVLRGTVDFETGAESATEESPLLVLLRD